MLSYQNIQTNLYQKARSRFGSRNKELDREKKLFIDWMACELYEVHKMLYNTRDYSSRQVLRHIQADSLKRTVPAHCLLQAHPQGRKALKPAEDLFTIGRYGEEPPGEIYFSPAFHTSLAPAKIRWKAVGNSLIGYKEGQHPKEHARMTSDPGPGVMWIGLEIKDKKTKELIIPCYFNWWEEAEDQRLEELLPLIRWSLEDQPLEASAGMEHIRSAPVIDRHLDTEKLFLKKIENEVRQAYEGRFISLHIPADLGNTPVPKGIADALDEEALKELESEALVWIKLAFPHGFSPELLQKTSIQFNCFPAINRKLDKSKDFGPDHHGSIEILALSNSDSRGHALTETGEFFLAIERIFSSKIDYRSTTWNQFNDVATGHYALQRGNVEADDFRDMLARTGELCHMLEAHAPKVHQVSEHSVQQAIQTIRSGCTEIEEALANTPAYLKEEGYYLHLKARDPQDMIYVQFWLSQGSAAEGLVRSGDLLIAERSNGLEGDAVWAV
jgi:hypothetical protein